MKYLFCFIPLLLLFSCSDVNEIPTDTESAIADKPTMEFIDLSEGGLPLALAIEKGTVTDVSAKWNAAFGRMEITDFNDISIFVFQDTLSCASKKAEIEGGIFEVSYLVDTDSLIFYKTVLPDGTTPYWHFFASFLVANVHYIFENNPLIEVTENEIETMTRIVANIHESRDEKK